MASSLLPRSMTMNGISKLKCVQILQIANQTNQIHALNNMDNCFKFEHIKYHFIFEIIILTAEKFFDIIKDMIFFFKRIKH